MTTPAMKLNRRQIVASCEKEIATAYKRKSQ